MSMSERELEEVEKRAKEAIGACEPPLEATGKPRWSIHTDDAFPQARRAEPLARDLLVVLEEVRRCHTEADELQRGGGVNITDEELKEKWPEIGVDLWHRGDHDIMQELTFLRRENVELREDLQVVERMLKGATDGWAKEKVENAELRKQVEKQEGYLKAKDQTIASMGKANARMDDTIFERDALIAQYENQEEAT